MRVKIKSIPTVIGLSVLLLGLAAGVFLVQKGQNLFLKAGPELTPKQMKITNITDRSFSVSWITDAQTSGFLKYGTDQPENTAGDDRDQLSGKVDSFYIHHVTIKDLSPSTSYVFKIGSGDKIFDDNGQPYQTKTGPTISAPAPINDIAYGTVITSKGLPAEGDIVYLSVSGAVTQSVLTKSSGGWAIPLNLIRSSDLVQYLTYDKETTSEEIFVQGISETATATTLSGNDSPTPNIILGQHYDFRQTTPSANEIGSQTAVVPAPTSGFHGGIDLIPTSTPSLKPGASPTPTTPVQPLAPEARVLTVTNPKEGEEINTQTPAFIGLGPKGETVSLNVAPSSQSTSLVVPDSGGWNWTAPLPLSAGDYKLTASAGAGSQKLTVVRNFTVLAENESDLPAMVASPSATPSTKKLSPTPTQKLKPTPTATISGRTGLPSTQSGIPVSGNLTPTLVITIMGFVLLIGGVVLRYLL